MQLGLVGGFGELEFASGNGARNTSKAEAAPKCAFQACCDAFGASWN